VGGKYTTERNNLFVFSSIACERKRMHVVLVKLKDQKLKNLSIFLRYFDFDFLNFRNSLNQLFLTLTFTRI